MPPPASGRGSRTSTSDTSAGLPALERDEQPLLELRRHVLLPQPPCDRDRLPHLLEVDVAAVAQTQVRLEASPVARRKPVFEVVGDDLDDLDAGERLSPEELHPRYSS